jgi:hypothetical protein
MARIDAQLPSGTGRESPPTTTVTRQPFRAVPTQTLQGGFAMTVPATIDAAGWLGGWGHHPNIRLRDGGPAHRETVALGGIYD